MMKCLNCDSSALFVYENPTVAPQPYCNAHLPSFMRPLAKAGLLATTDAYAEIKKSVLGSLAAPAAEEAPAPSRKRRGKRVEQAPSEDTYIPVTNTDDTFPEDVPVVEEDPEAEPETTVAE